ncbi:MAG TPA: class I SAM-dependent methyltransferase [Candidatus Angelobacter sp.]|nr:class I SAM-dependent methyltransferase [Candidatus Angelobacter sp.]
MPMSLSLEGQKDRAIRIGMRIYNSFFVRSIERPVPALPELKQIEEHAALESTDICDHLATIFGEALAARPGLIVELGVRGGETRFVFEKVSQLTGSALVSADIEDCSSVCSPSPRWHFVQKDDVQFAAEFPAWCRSRGIDPQIDVLFIDTSHIYEHTVCEIKAWFPLLAPKCKVIFHDTNMGNYYRQQNGTIRKGWDNQRGVIRAIEEHLGTRFNEKISFVTTVNEWLVRHWPYCSGLTVMERS